MILRLVNLFPVWAILFSITAYIFPDNFASMKTAIVPLLTLVMFGMGITLKFHDFVETFKEPKVLILGVSLQFIVMPLAAFLIGILFGFDKELIAGMVILGASPGGTASNVITYLARGRVALSIALTSISTLLAVLLTPGLSYFYLSQIINVPFTNMLLSVLQIILVPVSLGIVVNTFWSKKIERLKNYFPLLSVFSIVLIISIIVALNKTNLQSMAMLLVLGVVLHNSIGLLAGYYITRLFGYDSRTCRTIAIEVGMQNSGLAVALAVKFYSAAAALPGAVFSVWHNLSGSLLAGIWNRTSKDSNDNDSYMP